MMDATYKLDELAREAGTSPRTVRYYVQRGLLPAPAFRGKDTAYGREHLIRLRAIRRLQEAFLPLDAIVAQLADKSLDEIEAIAEAKSGAEPPSVERQTPPVAPSNGARRDAPSGALGGRLYRRIELAPGVELSIADDAPAASRQVVERILKDMERKEA